MAQNIDHNVDKVRDYVSYVNSQIDCGAYNYSNVVNMDETNVYFEMVGSTTLEKCGSRTVNIKSSGSSSLCTVILDVIMSGDKLPPMIVFKGTPDGRISREWTRSGSKFPATNTYTTQNKAWVDHDVFQQWVAKVWRPFCESREGATYLVQDCGSEVDMILNGYTSRLQTMDVGLNKPFKGYLKQNYREFMTLTPDKKPKRVDVAKWVTSAWDRITAQMIRNTWERIVYRVSYMDQLD